MDEATLIAAMIEHHWVAEDSLEDRVRKLCKAAVANELCLNENAQLQAVFGVLLTHETGDSLRGVQYCLDGLKMLNALLGKSPGVTVDPAELSEEYEGIEPVPVGKWFHEELEADKVR